MAKQKAISSMEVLQQLQKTLDRKLVSKEDEELSTLGFEFDARASKLKNELLWCFMLSAQTRSSL